MVQLFAKNSRYAVDNSNGDQFVALEDPPPEPDGTNAGNRNNFAVAFFGDPPDQTDYGKGWFQGSGFNTPATGIVGAINYDYEFGNTPDVTVDRLSTLSITLETLQTADFDFFMTTIWGGDDLFYGGAFDDTLYGYEGDDTIFGGYGDKPDSGRPVAGSTTDADFTTYPTYGYDSDGDDTLRGGAGNDTIDGGTGADALFGDSGDDTLFGGGGTWGDTLDGGIGADTMSAGDGDDTYVVDDVGDTISENADEGRDTVQASINYTLGDNLENLWLLGGDDLNGIGNALRNLITGNTGANMLAGNAGNDKLNGGKGRDALDGGTGRDVLNGGKSADVLVGGKGNDVLKGASHNDMLTGDAGRDWFVFGKFGAKANKDTVADFQDNWDRIKLDDALWDGVLTAEQVVEEYAKLRDGTVVLDFGKTEIRFTGVTDAVVLIDDITIV